MTEYLTQSSHVKPGDHAHVEGDLKSKQATAVQMQPEEQCAILIVDDDPYSHILLHGILSTNGYRIIQIEDSQQALKAYLDHRPGVLLLDCMFPEGPDGFEVCRQIVSHPIYTGEPILFTTSLTDPEDVMRGFDAGGVDFMRKPLTQEETIARVHTHWTFYKRQIQERNRAERFGKQLQIAEQGLTVKNERLDQVREGQLALLTQPDALPEIEVGICYESAAEAGGDFYEMQQLGEDTFGFFVADVSGHDLRLSHVTGALKALALGFMNDSMSATDTIVMMNHALLKILPDMDYVTACYMKYHRAASRLEIINAAHPNALLLPKEGPPRYLELTGDVLGMFDAAFCETDIFDVNPGDRIYLYTDGIVEEIIGIGEETGSRGVGERWLSLALEQRRTLPIQQQCNNVIKAFHAQNPLTSDDVLLMGVQL